MKKILLIVLLMFAFIPVSASEIEDDYLDIAADYCVIGNYNNAMEYIDKVLAINPSNQRAADLKKGLNHVIHKDKKSFVDNVSPLIRQAMEYKRQGSEQAEYESLVLAAKDQNSYLAYYYLGDFYRNKNKYSKAIDAYNASTSKRPSFAPAYLASAVVLFDMGKYDSVINPIDKYISLNSNDDLAYALKSRANFALGNFSEAKKYNQIALKMNNCPEYKFDKAKILYMEGDYKESRDLFTNLLKDIQTSKIYEYMGLCDYALQDYNSALINFDKAILLSNDDQYLESKYNEIKQILEQKTNEEIQSE